MPKEHNLNISNLITEIRRVHTWLSDSFKQMGLPEDMFFRFDLSSEEIVTNLISYAYEDNRPHEIVLRLLEDEKSVTLEIEDDGESFNPLEYPKIKAPTSLEDAKIGGLGIHLVRHHIDDGDYVRRDGKNILRLMILKN